MFLDYSCCVYCPNVSFCILYLFWFTWKEEFFRQKKQHVYFIYSHQHNYFCQLEKTCVNVFRLNKWMILRSTGCVQNIPSNQKFSMAVEAEQVSPDGPAIIPGLIPGLLTIFWACEKLPKCKDYAGQICKRKQWHGMVVQHFYPILSCLVIFYPCTYWPLLLMSII